MTQKVLFLFYGEIIGDYSTRRYAVRFGESTSKFLPYIFELPQIVDVVLDIKYWRDEDSGDITLDWES